MLSEIRNGNFTSSNIYKLMANGQGENSIGAIAYEYVQERNMERRLGRSIQDEVTARALSWGKLVEKRAFYILGLDYTLCSQKTLQHNSIPYWVGSPDAVTETAVADIKCPMTLKSFCQLVDGYMDYKPMTIQSVINNHKDGEKYFWQIVSNGVLSNKKKGELIVYVPYLDELEEIREMARQYEGSDQYQYYWISNARDSELPHLIRGGYYNNINVIAFDIIQSDVDALTKRVETLGNLLIDRV